MIGAIILSAVDAALPATLAQRFPEEEVLGLWLVAPADAWTGDAALLFQPPTAPPSAREVVRNVQPQLKGRELHAIYLRDGNLQREVAAGLAAGLEGSCLAGCGAVHQDAAGRLQVAMRPFAGRAEAEIEILRLPFVATLRDQEGSEIAPARPAAPARNVDWLPAEPPAWTTLEQRASQADGIDMARYIVSGGLGLGSRESFGKLSPLAERLEASVGATLAAVEAGWATVELQIGQTGNTVRPEIYLAIGISGAPQHVSGVYAKHMLAVNKDPGAPIFHVADVGVVGDATAFVEALTAALHQALASPAP